MDVTVSNDASIHTLSPVVDQEPGQENSAFDICVHAFNCVRLRLREFNLHTFVGPSMHLDALYPDSQCLSTILVNYVFC